MPPFCAPAASCGSPHRTDNHQHQPPASSGARHAAPQDHLPGTELCPISAPAHATGSASRTRARGDTHPSALRRAVTRQPRPSRWRAARRLRRLRSCTAARVSACQGGRALHRRLHAGTGTGGTARGGIVGARRYRHASRHDAGGALRPRRRHTGLGPGGADQPRRPLRHPAGSTDAGPAGRSGWSLTAVNLHVDPAAQDCVGRFRRPSRLVGVGGGSRRSSSARMALA